MTLFAITERDKHAQGDTARKPAAVKTISKAFFQGTAHYYYLTSRRNSTMTTDRSFTAAHAGKLAAGGGVVDVKVVPEQNDLVDLVSVRTAGDFHRVRAGLSELHGDLVLVVVGLLRRAGVLELAVQRPAEHLDEGAVVVGGAGGSETVRVGEVQPAVVGLVALDAAGLAHQPLEGVSSGAGDLDGGRNDVAVVGALVVLLVAQALPDDVLPSARARVRLLRPVTGQRERFALDDDHLAVADRSTPEPPRMKIR